MSDGAALASALPKITLRLRITIVLFIVTVRLGFNASNGFAVTAALVLIVKLVALNVAPLTVQLPFRLVIPELPILTVSPVLIPNVNGVYSNNKVVPVITVPVVELLR